MFFDELMIGSNFIDLEQSMFLYDPSIILNLSLSILKRHEFMLSLDAFILLQLLLNILNLLGKLAGLVEFGSRKDISLSTGEHLLLLRLDLASREGFNPLQSSLFLILVVFHDTFSDGSQQL